MHRRAWVLMVALAALWGASYMFIHIALEDGVSAPGIVWVRIVLGALALTLLARGALRSLRGLRREVTLLGVVLLFGLDLSSESKLALGGAMVLLAAFGYAVGAIWVRRDFAGVPSVAVAAGTMIVASIATLPPALADPGAGDANLGTAAALLVLGVGGTGIAFYVFFWLIAEVGASRASVVAYLAPGFAVTYGAIFLGEAITASTLAGLALILAGSWIAAEGRLPWQPATPIVLPEPCGEDALSRSEPSRSSAPAPELAQRSPAA